MKFYVEEFIPCVQVMSKYVDANSAEEALRLFHNEDIETTTFTYDDHNYDNIEYRVFETGPGTRVKVHIFPE